MAKHEIPGRYPSCEVLINFMYEELNRFLGHPDQAENFDSFFGTPNWREGVVIEDPKARYRFLRDLYFRACRATGSREEGGTGLRSNRLLAVSCGESDVRRRARCGPAVYAAAALANFRRLKPSRARWPAAAIISVDLTLGLLKP
jgi:hypothetical protein